jgi:ubiquinone/menaquinone biosynthesis C-methylase UbiE
MSKEKYIVEIGEEGSEGLGKLDHFFNPTTQEFLLSAGLKPGMTVLDIGCGSGVMTGWIAKVVGENGKVIGIENDQNQLNAAQRNAKKLALENTEFKLCSAYEIDSLNQQFDFIYCRFVLHHLHAPMDVIAKIYQVLKPKGIYAAEEGIVNFAFSYPFSPAWGDECVRISPPWVDAEKDQRDGNIGIKMFNKMYKAGFKIITSKIIHPLLTTHNEKALLLSGKDELKNHYLEQGHSEEEWIAQGKETEKIVNDGSLMIGFYASCQVAGLK